MKLLSFEGVEFKRPNVFKLFGVREIVGFLMLVVSGNFLGRAFFYGDLSPAVAVVFAFTGVFLAIFALVKCLPFESFNRHGADLKYATKRLDDVERFYGITFPDWQGVTGEDRRKYTSPVEALALAMRGETSTTLFSYGDATINPDASGLRAGIVREIHGQWVVLELTPRGTQEALKPVAV